jgi:hypothetical protein
LFVDGEDARMQWLRNSKWRSRDHLSVCYPV